MNLKEKLIGLRESALTEKEKLEAKKINRHREFVEMAKLRLETEFQKNQIATELIAKFDPRYDEIIKELCESFGLDKKYLASICKEEGLKVTVVGSEEWYPCVTFSMSLISEKVKSKKIAKLS